MHTGEFTVATSRQFDFIDITGQIAKALKKTGEQEGICYLYNPHTTAGLTINEGADPAVRDDILAALKTIVPMRHPYKHLEGNSPAHVMASLIGASVTVFVSGGKLALGTWQKIFFCEFDGPRTRSVRWRLL